MSERPLRVRGIAPARALLIGLLLAACAAAGFLLQRYTVPQPTLYPAPQGAGQAPIPSAPEGGAPAPTARVVPERVPDLELPDAAGRMHRLTEWRGKPLLINFWATWCEPCRREIPLLGRLQRERAPQGLRVIGIALDSRQAVQAYTAARRIDYPVLLGEQGGLAAVSAFGMDTVLPFSVFADPSGQVIALKVGELHRDEADFILDRVRDLVAGRLSVAATREAISGEIERLSAARQTGSGTADH